MDAHLNDRDLDYYWLRWLWDGRNDQIHIWEVNPYNFNQNSHFVWIEKLGLGDEANFTVGYIYRDGVIGGYFADRAPDHVLIRLEEWVEHNAYDVPFQDNSEFDPTWQVTAASDDPVEWRRNWPVGWAWYTSWIYLPEEHQLLINPTMGTNHGALWDKYDGDFDTVQAVYGLLLYKYQYDKPEEEPYTVYIFPEYSDWARGRMEGTRELPEDGLQQLISFINNEGLVYGGELGKDGTVTKTASQITVEEAESNEPEGFHDAWVFDPVDNILYFMHGGHHAEIYERMVDPDLVDRHDGWCGDIQYGTIRYYDTARELNIFDDPRFEQIMGMVKALSRDYTPEQIDLDLETHAKKLAWTESEMRWFWDPIQGLVVWNTDVEDYALFHSSMAKKLYGPNWYEYPDYTGGYIYRDGRVRQNYTSDKAWINTTGYEAAENYAKQHTQITMDPNLLPYRPEGASNVAWTYLDYNAVPLSSLDWKAIYFPELNQGFWWFIDRNLWPHHYDVVDGNSNIAQMVSSTEQMWECTGFKTSYVSDGNVPVWNFDAWPETTEPFFQREIPAQIADHQGAHDKISKMKVDAMLKWTYPPGGPINVWAVDDKGMPNHAEVTGFDVPDAQGHIYLMGPQVGLYVHRDRPYLPFGQQGGQKFDDWRENLQAEALGAAKDWVTHYLQAPDSVEMDNMETPGRRKRWGKAIRPKKPRRHHIRKNPSHHLFITYPIGYFLPDHDGDNDGDADDAPATTVDTTGTP